MAVIDTLIDIVFDEEYDRLSAKVSTHTAAGFKLLFSQYKRVLRFIQSEKHWETTEIDDLQQLLDDFCINYVTMLGMNKVTNYIHTLMCGHVR
jgi:hypothetical protein